MENNLFKISLLISLIGIFLLLVLSNILEPKIIDISKINNPIIGEAVKIQGQIFNIREYPDSNFQVISIKDETGKVDVTTDRILNLTNNQEIIVIGVVKEYKEFLQVQANRIVLK